jgi:hypothetical protein
MFILALNEFLVSLLLVDARIMTLPVQIYNSIRSIITPDLAAISVVLTSFSLWPNLFLSAALLTGGGLALVQRRIGMPFVLGLAAWILPASFNTIVLTLYYDIPIASSWWVARGNNLMLLGAVVLAGLVVIKDNEVRFSKLSAVVIPVGVTINLVSVIGRVLPAGTYTVNFGDPTETGELFTGPVIAHFGPVMWIALALLLPVLAGFFHRIRTGGALLAGWATAAGVGGIVEAVRLLRQQTIDGDIYSGSIGAGLVLRLGAAVLLAAFAVVVMSRKTGEAAPEPVSGATPAIEPIPVGVPG